MNGRQRKRADRYMPTPIAITIPCSLPLHLGKTIDVVIKSGTRSSNWFPRPEPFDFMCSCLSFFGLSAHTSNAYSTTTAFLNAMRHRRDHVR